MYNKCEISLQISWVRRRDWNILTHGVNTFTTDKRFKVQERKKERIIRMMRPLFDEDYVY